MVSLLCQQALVSKAGAGLLPLLVAGAASTLPVGSEAQ